jgi:hypothetical protein
MRAWFCVPAAAAILICVLVLPVAAQSVTINATPSVAHLGDLVVLNGTVSGVNTIAVFLFLTGPDLDSRGVTLENLNIPAGRGLFTTAPVDMKQGTWMYLWDTSIVLGNMNPGTYTVWAVTSPVDRERSSREEFASAQITFLPTDTEPTPVPLPAGLTVAALGITIVAGSCMIRRLKNS